MPKFQLLFINIIFFLLIAFSSGYAQTNEQITLTTYYPSPYGSYVELRSKRIAVGDNYISPVYCWPPTACANPIGANADLVVEGNVGIGTFNPASLLHLQGTLPKFTITNTIANKAWSLRSERTIDGRADLFLRYENSALDILTVRENGFVGIGFDPSRVPLAKLNITNGGDILLSRWDASIGNPYGELRFGSEAFPAYYSAVKGYCPSNGAVDADLRFYTSNSGAVERMRIDRDGNVGIGTQAPAYQLELSLDSAAKPTSNTWTVPSDRRVKKDIEPFNDGLDVINQINPVRYRLNGKAGLPLNKEGISIIAQDIKDVAPYTIKTWKAKLEPADKKETDLYDFDSSPLTFVIINAIKEQQRKIEKLEAEIVELKSRLSTRE